MNYNQTAIRKMLDDAFSKSDLNTLVFDHFGELYEELPSKKSEFIMALVNYADRQGKIQAILDFTKRENGYQYDRYIGSIRGSQPENSPASNSPSMPASVEQADLFISYSRKDVSFAQQLNSSLRNNKFSTWIDEIGIRGADDWTDRIALAIEQCKILVVVLSPDSMESEWVKRELSLADSKGKKILPVIYRKTNFPGWYELRFGTVQWVDFSAGTYQQNFSKLLNALQRF